jgi:hypothetical protein
VESYIRAKRVGFAKIGIGDNRGPVANDSHATFRTQSLITVDLKNKGVSLNTAPGISEVFFKGFDPKLGIANAQLSSQSVDSSGSIHFTLSTFGLNGQAAAGNPLAPQSWIEYTFNFIVDPKGTVVLSGRTSKAFPSISVFSYSNGKTTDLFRKKRARMCATWTSRRETSIPGPGQILFKKTCSDSAVKGTKQHVTRHRTESSIGRPAYGPREVLFFRAHER